MTMLADMPYAALYAEHEPAARRLALTLVPSHAAEDIVAEAFTRVLDTAGRRGLPLAFRPYLLTAVRNEAHRYHARHRRLVLVPDPEPSPVPGPEHAVMAREDARLAAAAFAALPARWRWVLWETAVQERSAGELAAAAGMAPNTVSQLASRAREGLRQAYLAGHLAADLPPPCRVVAPFMGAAVRGKAGRRHAAQLAAHLRGCTRCAQAYQGLGSLNTSLGELLVPGAVVTVLARSARAAGRGLRLHPLGAAAVVSAISAVTVPFASALPAAPPAHAQVRAAGHPALEAAVAPSRPAYVPRHARALPGGTVLAEPPGGPVGQFPPPATPAPAGGGTGLAQAVVPGAGQAACQLVTSAGQAVSQLVPVVPAGQLGQVAGGTVQDTTGQLGQAAGGLLPGL